MRYALALLAAASPALAAVQELWWNLTYVENANPDGLAPRRVIGVNGTWPPPLMDVSQDDLLILHTTNSLDLPATMHHHGMFFNSTSWFDGALGVSQCGIPTGQSFDYIVPINSSGQWGSYWTHAHSNGQYVDGLRTSLVIHPTQEAHQYDEEFTVILGDWYHDEHSVLINQFINIANPGGAEPIPDAALVYFGQNGTYLPPITGRNPDPVTAAVGFNENATLPFQPGKTYRLRIVNTSAFAAFFFWIDGHDMRIIEADGIDTEEYATDIISITVAQRYSVLVTARNDTSANWAIHANMDTVMFDTVPDTLQPNITSSVSYALGAPLTDSGFIDNYHDIADQDLVPVQVIPQLPPATKTFELEVSFDTMDDGTNHAMFNLLTYNTPLVPSVLSQMTLGTNATDQNAYGPYSFVLDHNDIYDIVVKNSDTGKHPFHLHGHKFQLIGRAQDYTSTDPTLNPPLVEGQANPMKRDTVQVPSMNSVTLRIAADNPGVWMFHCHIEWHLEVGLAVLFIEAPIEAQERNAVPQYLIDQCASQNIATSGNAAAHSDPDDLVGLPAGPFPQILGWRPKGIGAMAGCVLTAVIGMLTVTWYALGGHISDAEMEHEERIAAEAKERRGRFLGLAKVFKRS
ncbi:hypothetical protein EUX98_g3197 [Antrodiella citrinella]|uniref:Laccase n=1 Tax=Antrodiella citrinella TaxID=2447956 RepID=A0A4S4MZQ3_9APHY|nr:hypothetical protein EUX98_g3197 [Antrodiella citrinella]